MGKSRGEDNFNRRRLRASYFSVIISIGLVLFLLGIAGTLIHQARSLTEDLKENFTFTLFLKSSASQSQIDALQSKWAQSPEVRSMVFVSKEVAAETFTAELGEDFIQDILGVNPFSDALDMKLRSEFVSPEQLTALEARLSRESIVEDMIYDRDLVSLIHQNVGRITTIMFAIVAGLLLISMALINSSIRLSIYAKRFTIKTMQLVGATRAFIHRPFMAQGLRLGLFGAIVGSLLLALTFFIASEYLPAISHTLPWSLWAMMSGGMLLIGTLITTGSTAAAVNRYLALNTNKLYER